MAMRKLKAAAWLQTDKVNPLEIAGQNFVLSLFDRLWHKDITEEEAVRLMELGIEEVIIHD